MEVEPGIGEAAVPGAVDAYSIKGSGQAVVDVSIPARIVISRDQIAGKRIERNDRSVCRDHWNGRIGIGLRSVGADVDALNQPSGAVVDEDVGHAIGIARNEV